MSSLSKRLGLRIATLGDNFRTADYQFNWGQLDAYPGYFICTSTTRPTTWGSAQVGMRIVETDTGLAWQWDGTVFNRASPMGLLGRALRTSDISTSSSTLVTAVTATTTVPAGGRSVLVIAEGPGVYNTAGATRISLQRGSTVLATWLQRGLLGSGAEQPTPLAFTTVDVPTQGTNTYSIMFGSENGIGGTSTLQGGINGKQLAISVVEV